MQAWGELVVICERCNHKNKVPLKSPMTKQYDASNHLHLERPPGGWNAPPAPADPITTSVKVPALRAGIFAVAGGGIVLASLFVLHAPKPLFWWLVSMLAIYLALFGRPEGAKKSKGPNSAKLRRDGPPPTIHITTEENGGKVTNILHLEACSEKQLKALAVSYTAGRSVTQSAMCGKGRPFTRGVYDNTRDELIEKGYAQWKSAHGKNQSWEPTYLGTSLFRYYSTHK